MEPILSLLLGDDDKKGEKIVKCECKQLTLKNTNDENPDGGKRGGQKDSERRRGEELVGVSGSSKAITRFKYRQGGDNKRNERGVEDLTMTPKMQQSLQVTTAANKTKDTEEKCEEEEINQAHQRRKIYGAEWADKLKLTSDIAQVKEAIIQPITTSDSTHVIDFLNPIQVDLSNYKSEDIVSDNLEFTFEEKKKLLSGRDALTLRKHSYLTEIGDNVIFQGVLKLWLKGYKVIILDIPLLFEVKMDKWTSPTIVVWVDPETQLTRLMERDGTSMEDEKNRIDAQKPLDLKKAKADIVIDNTGSFEELNEKFYKGNGLLQKLKFIVVLSSDLRLHLEKEERAKLKETEEPGAPAYSDEEPELMEKETMFALQETGEQYYDDENDVEYEYEPSAESTYSQPREC
ncbi:hypothetical protein AgCh_018536 [Apium graveolens]